MAVLVDTSVWVEHFRVGNAELSSLLKMDEVLVHPFVIAELACGTPPKREQTLKDLSLLRHATQANVSEVLDFIENRKLYGRGCGYVDMTLLASVLLTPASQLWTYDKRLNQLADEFSATFRL
ncbi:type II toxin-antitoxin system VapC family toxin [Bacterioplanoides sp.]|uniref:type II toxin-antitoxin system VapC family toxin n=1 Tax=Bacterioplanoides sp. TaxID=2066072 RepID=UPI003AFF6905